LFVEDRLTDVHKLDHCLEAVTLGVVLLSYLEVVGDLCLTCLLDLEANLLKSLRIEPEEIDQAVLGSLFVDVKNREEGAHAMCHRLFNH